MSSESSNKSIIAMKGHPFTRKSQFAAHIAASLTCPLLCLDHFLDALSPDYLHTCSCSNARTPVTSPEDTAFRIISEITKSHLSMGLFKHIVIDSPLSSRSHLDQLINLASSLEQTRLVIIECKANNIYDWQTKFEEYLEHNHPDETQEKWYKAKSWEDIEKKIRVGYDERSDGYNVSKLVLDPISDYQDSMGTPPFMDAVEHMIMRNEDDGPDLVVYQRWRQTGPYLSSREDVLRSCYFREMQGSKILRFCTSGGGHYIVTYTKEGLDYAAKCRACKKKVKGAAYTCNHCSFALHRKCAELLDYNNNPPLAPSHEELSMIVEGWIKLDSRFRHCISCEEGYNRDSYHCDDCFFTSHLKEHRFPTIIRHGCDEHFLSIMYAYLNPSEEHFQCRACGDPVEMVWYSCKICGVAYHYNCLTEVPDQVEHEHGGHHHHMLIQYSSPEAEDYLCDVCFENEAPERRDPNCWFYSCQECAYVAHLHCVGDGGINQEENDDDDDQLKPCRVGKGHHIANYTEEGLEYEAKCRVCENQVIGAAYTCKPVCKFALHKECAESYSDINSPLLGLLSLVENGYKAAYEEDICLCTSCDEEVDDDSGLFLCGDCLITTHLKKKVLPTVIRHECHEHFLSIVMQKVHLKKSDRRCNACGGYFNEIWYSCKTCGLDYHYHCLMEEVVRKKREHNPDHQSRSMHYSIPKGRDYICEVCFERVDPKTYDSKTWFYTCDDCEYIVHVECLVDTLCNTGPNA